MSFEEAQLQWWRLLCFYPFVGETTVGGSKFRNIPALKLNRTAKNIVSVVGGETALRIANFAAVVVIARLYGPSTLGLYATALAFATIAVTVAENGLQISTITEIGRSPDRINRLFGSLYSLRVALFLILLSVLAMVGLLRRWNLAIWVVGGLVTLRVVLYSCSQLQFAVLKGLDRMKVIGPIQFLNFGLISLGIAGAYLFSWKFVTLLWCFVFAQVVEIAVTLFFLSGAGVRPFPFIPSNSWTLLKNSLPFGLTYVLAAATVRADVLVLSAMASRDEVGRFAAANIGLTFIYAASWLVGSVLLADQVRLSEFPSKGIAYIRHWRKILIFTTIPGSLMLSWLAPPIVQVLYGKGFETTGRLASVMVLAVPLILLNATFSSRAMAMNSRKVYLGTYVGTGVVALCLDVVLGHLYGAIGIAFAIFLREAFMFMTFLIWDLRSPICSTTLDGSVAGDQPLGNIGD